MKRLLLAAVLGCAAGCGYGFTAGGPGLPKGIHQVFAPVVVNRTSEPGLEAVFTDALREQLARAGTLGGEGSEARLEGELLSVSAAVAQLAPGTSGALTYRVAATLRVRLFRNGALLSLTDVSGTEAMRRLALRAWSTPLLAALSRVRLAAAIASRIRAGSFEASASRAFFTADFTSVRTDWLRIRRLRD